MFDVVSGCIQQLLVENASDSFRLDDSERAVVERDNLQFSHRYLLVCCAVLRYCSRTSS
jgi:hypothetical protein